MLKFFRNTRKRLMTEGKMRNYIFYAIGEIFLVVVGILIALQINNWNERRKNTNYIETLFDTIEEDLVSNIEKANQVYQVYTNYDYNSRLILTNKLSKADYLNNPDLFNTIYNWVPFNPLVDNLVKLIEKEESVPKKYKSTLLTIKNLKNLSLDFSINSDMERVRENRKFLESEFPGAYRRDSITLAAKADFYLSSEIYKNRVYMTWVNRSGYLSRISSYRSYALGILIELKRIRNNYNPDQAKALLASFDMQPFIPLSCQESGEDNIKDVREAFLIYNFTSDTRYFTCSYLNGAQKYEGMVKPNDFHVTDRSGIQYDKGFTRKIEFLEHGQCTQQFISRQQGYLIIE